MNDASFTVMHPEQMDRNQIHGLLNSVVVPRPIAWISSVSPDGVANLAPHSYATIVSLLPPTVMFVSIGAKDTVSNIRESGEFVYHVADRELAEAMNRSSASAPRDVSEFDFAGLERLASTEVGAPRVLRSPVALECKLESIIEVGSEPAFMILGRVVLAHVADRVLDERGRIDAGKLGAIARMGGSLYSTTEDRFSMQRPDYNLA